MILPDGWTEDQGLPYNFQSLGANAVGTIVGKILLGVFPPDRPWIQQIIAPQYEYDPNIDPARLQAVKQQLFLQDLTILALLETPTGGANKPLGFHNSNRQAFEQIVATGDTLERIDDEFQVTVFDRPSYVTKRYADTSVAYHVTCEHIDPLGLKPEQLAKANVLRSDLEGKTYAERCGQLYTMVEWQPETKKWVVRQEFKDVEINQFDEGISRYISTPFNLAPGHNYGRGLVEANMGDLGTFDSLRARLLDYAVLASKLLTVLDKGSIIREKDLAKPSGSIIRGEVEGGKVMKAGMMVVDKLADISGVIKVMEDTKGSLGQSFLMDSASVRDSERTTLGEIEQVTIQELQGRLGGVYAPIQGRQQIPKFERAKALAAAKGLIKKLPDNIVKTRVLSGIAALVAQSQAGRLVSFVEIAKNMGEQTLARINDDVLLDVLARYQGVAEPGLIKSTAQRDAEIQKALQVQAQQAAIEQGAKTAGAVVENEMASRSAA